MDSYFKKPHPKSLDIRYFLNFYKIVTQQKLSIEDKISTLTFLTIDSIHQTLINLNKNFKNIVIIGGGANNKFVIDKLKEHFNNLKTGSEIGLNNDFIESELISYLAARKLYNLPTTFKSTTGVSKPTVCGEIFYP